MKNVKKHEGKRAKKVCRDLHPADLYFEGWTRCCDVGNAKSQWTDRRSKKAETYDGSCVYWGIFSD
ncbi:MAG: hypothetical protein GY822_10905 [Deltaproteobacteria bacterium]|nr:hypothetical protein [Deltaproteobacteria bacterium]